jgi:hypothetical protein
MLPLGIRHARWAVIIAAVLVPVAGGSALILRLLPDYFGGVIIDARTGVAVGRDIKTYTGISIQDIQQHGLAGGENSFVRHPLGSSDDVTLTLAKDQADLLIRLLQEAEKRSSQQASSPDPALSPATSATTYKQEGGSTRTGSPLAAAVAATVDSSGNLPLITTAPSRLAAALPLLLAFIGSTSLIVILMVYAGVILVRAGAAGGGTKIDILGMKVDAKGSGIAAIASGAVVLIATFRPLIDAFVTISKD